MGCKLSTKTCMVANKLYICAARHRVAVPASKDVFPITPYHPMPMESPPPPGVGLPYEKCKDLRQRRSCITEFLNPKFANSELLAIYSLDYLLEKFWYWKELSTIQMWAATFSYFPIFLASMLPKFSPGAHSICVRILKKRQNLKE